jgi:HEPN domain-containing protein
MWDSRAEAERWRRQAANDLAFARVALRERFYAQACFVAQQAAEKAVKAVAYGLGERTVIGHSLVTLILRYGDRAHELRDLRELAGILDQYYVPTRYPNGLAGGVPFEAFGESQAAAAVDAADRFVRLAERADASAD